MLRLAAIGCFVLAAAAGCTSIDSGDFVAKSRPNILFIVVDDLNTALGSYGHDIVQSPHIDNLASSGVAFSAAYSQYPVCAPSRASFLTGLYPEQTGVLRNENQFRASLPDVVTLPQLFRQSGYFSARTGKIFHYAVPRDIGSNGADDPESWDEVINPKGDETNLNEQVSSVYPEGNIGATLTWLRTDLPAKKHTDSLVTDAALGLLEAHHPEKTNRPFFLGVGYFRPHVPLIAPSSDFEKYPLSGVPTPPPFEEDRTDIPIAALNDRPGQLEMTNKTRREVIQAYYASVTFVDQQIGRLLAGLDALGLRESTIVVLVSDHGFHLGEHGLWQKSDLFEESVRVPLIIQVPGMTGNGQVASAPVELVDLFPTIVELAGLQIDHRVSGESLVPMLTDPSKAIRDSAYSIGHSRAWQTRPEFTRESILGASIVTARYRYTEWNSGEYGRELYDHQSDADELRNLVDEESKVELVERLASRLAQRRLEARLPVDQ
jgi:arylsulfatase A-like enzyme